MLPIDKTTKIYHLSLNTGHVARTSVNSSCGTSDHSNGSISVAVINSPSAQVVRDSQRSSGMEEHQRDDHDTEQHDEQDWHAQGIGEQSADEVQPERQTDAPQDELHRFVAGLLVLGAVVEAHPSSMGAQ